MYNGRVERSREVRLWLTQVIFPIICGVTILYNTNYGFNNWVRQKVNSLKDKYSNNNYVQHWFPFVFREIYKFYYRKELN